VLVRARRQRTRRVNNQHSKGVLWAQNSRASSPQSPPTGETDKIFGMCSETRARHAFALLSTESSRATRQSRKFTNAKHCAQHDGTEDILTCELWCGGSKGERGGGECEQLQHETLRMGGTRRGTEMRHGKQGQLVAPTGLRYAWVVSKNSIFKRAKNKLCSEKKPPPHVPGRSETRPELIAVCG
jgi:hypothetical protein